MPTDYESCPRCQREAKDAISSNYFPLYVCNKCDEEFCLDAGCGGEKQVCPECGSNDISESVHRVYA